MIMIEGKNKYQIKGKGYFANVDYPEFLDLYTPIVGNDATILYFYLINHINECATLDDLLVHVGLTLSGFKNCKKFLEAVGLIDFLAHKNDDGNEFIFVTYLFKTPKKFFNDVIFNELLKRNIGETKVNELIKKYKINNEDFSGFKDVSSSFTDVYKEFTLNHDIKFDSETNEVLFEVEGRTLLNEFDFDVFFAQVYEKGRILHDAFTNEELNVINSLASMCQLNEEIMADFVIQSFNIYGKKSEKLDVKKLKNLCFNALQNSVIRTKERSQHPVLKGNTNIAKKIALMEELNSVKYLKLKQNNVSPVKSDLDIIFYLQNNLGLNDGVINALIDYVLATNNNVLSRSLIEKIGASLVRENIKTAKDTMDYLLKTKNSSKKEKDEQDKKDKNDDDDEEIRELRRLFDEASK